MTQPSDVTLCTIGKSVQERADEDSQDARTYRSLSSYLRRIYVITLSSDDRPFVRRRGRVISIGLAQRKEPIFTRLTFVVGAIRLGWRLDRRPGVDLFAVSDPLLSGLAGLSLRFIRRRPLLVHLQGQVLGMPVGGISSSRRHAMRTLARFVCRHADMVRCVSNGLLKAVLAAGIPRSRTWFLPSRVDTAVFTPGGARAWREPSKRQLDVEDSDVILFAGTFSRFKGVEHLVRALPLVLETSPTARLVLVGSGPLESELLELSGRLGLADKVRFVGRRPHDQMPRVFAAADVFVLPSMNEGLPRVILEAMASGLPIVATAVGGVPEIVENGLTGLIVPPGNHVALAAAICRVLENPEMAEDFGKAGRSFVERNHDREANIREYGRMVRTVAQAGRTRH